MRELLDHLETCGYRGRVIGIEHVSGLKREIEGLRESGDVAESLYEEYLSAFVPGPPEDLAGAKSVIVVTVPQPQVRTYFTFKGARLPVVVPPTYSDWEVSREEMRACLAAFLGERGYGVRRAYVPEKMLAARSGLARYGKNNITYIPESGSFHRPAAFYSDLPAPGLPLGEPQMLDMCRNCVACVRACPTGAIAQDRFLLRAERCITFVNELPSEFPEWVDPAWHNCVIGCMKCQLACPADRGVWGWVEERDGFDEDETGLILKGAVLDDLAPETRAKLERLHLDEYAQVLPRNLRVLISQKKQGSQA